MLFATLARSVATRTTTTATSRTFTSSTVGVSAWPSTAWWIAEYLLNRMLTRVLLSFLLPGQQCKRQVTPLRKLRPLQAAPPRHRTTILTCIPPLQLRARHIAQSDFSPFMFTAVTVSLASPFSLLPARSHLTPSLAIYRHIPI